MIAIGSSGYRTPARSCTGSGRPRSRGRRRDVHAPGRRRSRWIFRRPVRTSPACRASRRAPAGRSLMIASSAARSSVSARRPLRLVEQAGVLEGDAHARGERRQEALVGLAEGMRLEALETDDADHPVAGRDRDAEPGLGHRSADVDGRPSAAAPRASPRRSGRPVADDRGGDARPERRRVALEALTLVEVVRARIWFVDSSYSAMNMRVRREDRAHALADQLDDGVELELLARAPRRSR